ncbi:MAG: hypothetical protein GF313_00680 [Caldithrix sp.]|nr:hypothetical protein [Caldithrix sp.]
MTLFFINAVSMIIGFNVGRYIALVNSYVGLFMGLFVYATIISAINFLGTFIILSGYSLIRYRRLFSPFA